MMKCLQLFTFQDAWSSSAAVEHRRCVASELWGSFASLIRFVRHIGFAVFPTHGQKVSSLCSLQRYLPKFYTFSNSSSIVIEICDGDLD